MSHTGHGRGFGMTATEALGEKAEMQHLNNKLADYIDKVRELKKSAALGLDPRDYQDSMKQLENEVLKLKQLYEDEISKLRRKLNDANKKNSALEAENDKNATLNKQLLQLSHAAKRLEDDNAALQRALAAAQQTEAALIEKLKQKDAEAANGHKWSKDNTELRKQLNDEVKRRQDAEAAAKQANDKIDFDGRVHNQEVKELQERSRTQNDVIYALEKRLKALAKDDNNLPATLQKLRDANHVEMKKFQKETEDALNRNMDTLKRQRAEDDKAKQQLGNDNKQLEDTLRQLAARNEQLVAQNNGLQAANDSLRGENDSERMRAQQATKHLQQKLKDLEDQLLDHSKEFVEARDAQASLKSEIETYRVLLDQEGQRLASRQGSRTPSKPATPSYSKTHNGLPSISRQATPKTQSARGPRGGYRAGYSSFDTTYRVDYTPKHGRRY